MKMWIMVRREIVVPGALAAVVIYLITAMSSHLPLLQPKSMQSFIMTMLYWMTLSITAFLGAVSSAGDRENNSWNFNRSLPVTMERIWTERTMTAFIMTVLLMFGFYGWDPIRIIEYSPGLFLTVFAFSNLCGLGLRTVIHGAVAGLIVTIVITSTAYILLEDNASISLILNGIHVMAGLAGLISSFICCRWVE
jgi:hypothetical protein